jgi:hypothetical protein
MVLCAAGEPGSQRLQLYGTSSYTSEKVETERFMISPSPTQQPPQESVPERKVRSTPVRKRRGETRGALFVKAILRPPIKLLYYLIQVIKNHRLATLGVALLLVISISATTYVTTGNLPYGIGSDPFNFHVNGGDGGGDQIKNWLYALRDGDSTKLALVQSQLAMSQPPDPSQLIANYSQTQGHLTWNSIEVIKVYSEPDTTQDVFVAVDFSAPGPGGVDKGVMLWHFVTLPSARGRLISVEGLTPRQFLPTSG